MTVSTNSIVTSQAIRTANAVATAAKTTYGDATNAVAAFTAQSNGAVIYSIKAMPRAQVSTIIQCQIYRSPDAGTTLFLVATAAMATSNITTVTTAPAATDFGYSETNPLRFGNTDALYVGIGSALAGGVVFDVQMEVL